MVLGDHLSFELHQSVLDLRRIQFHDALHSPTCRASHLLTSLRHRRAGEFRWQRAHRSRSGSVAIFTVATTLTILAPTILSARIFAATKLAAGMFTAFSRRGYSWRPNSRRYSRRPNSGRYSLRPYSPRGPP